MSTPTWNNPIVKWIDYRLPVFTFIHHDLVEYPTPRNLNYWWNFGSLAGVVLVFMIATGFFLSMFYTPNTEMAFDSIERIMRDVNYGWLLRYLHSNGGSLFFMLVYIHLFRGMYYGSYKAPREILWMLGVLLLLMMMGSGFTGYVLVWGQMSFWAATVITNMFTAVPLIGETLVTWIWGGFSVDNPALNRFYSYHFILPFAIFAVVFMHLWALHVHKSSNPLGIDVKGPQDTIPFHPYYTTKDLFGMGVFMVIYLFFVFFAPNFFGEADNYIPADPLQTPPHIVPEWYFLPYYAILRAVPEMWFISAKLGGVIGMLGSIVILFFLPWLDTSKVRSARFRPVYKYFFWFFVLDCLILGWVGANSPDDNWQGIPFLWIGRMSTLYYFAHFIVILPLLGWFEKTRPLPESISKAVTDEGAATAEEAS